MKKIYLFLLSMLLVTATSHTSTAQERNSNGQPVALGKSQLLLRNLTKNLTSTQQTAGGSLLNLKVSDTKTLKAKVNLHKSEQAGTEILIGEIANTPGSSFFINFSEQGLRGNIILKKSKQAYKYYSDKTGTAYIKEISIDSLLCIEYEKPEASLIQKQQQEGFSTMAVTDLQSLPGANGVVLLDFDGQYVSGTVWNNGATINAQPSGMSAAAIQETWEMVAEDYRAFNINITTSEAVFNSYPRNRRMRCIITPTNTAAPGAGGVAYVGSFNWNDDTPCWTFITYAKGAGEATSHEIGHTLGLSHDGRTSPSEGYFQGHGNWAPIMGVGYSKSVTQWSKGEYAYANNREDDLAIITSSTYGLGYRTDDHGNSTTAASALKVDATGTLTSQNTGIIERNTDLDFFSFSTGGGTVTLNFAPAPRHADLDILVKLYNSAGSVLGTYDLTGLTSSINTNLASGKYFISVDGTGVGSASTTGYSDYASLGQYSITGKIPAGGSTGNQSPSVAITSPANGATFTPAATINITANATDTDGTIARVEFFNGSTKLGEDATAPYSFAWANVAAGSYSLKAVATDDKGATATSTAVNITVGQTTSCGVPTGLALSNITSNAATLAWTAQAADSYEVWWRVAGGTWTGGISTTANKVTATALQSNTQYQIAVAAYCAGTQTEYAYANFTTKANSTGGVATVYTSCNYGGTAKQLAPGNYTTAQLAALGINDNTISSLKVQSGYEVILYASNNYQGSAYVFRYDYSCLSYTSFDNVTSSVVVRASTAARAGTQAAALVAGNEPIAINAAPVVAPNPTADAVSVSFNAADAAFADVQIFDALGKKVMTFGQVRSAQSLDIRNLQAGMYIMKITIGNETFTQKVVKR